MLDPLPSHVSFSSILNARTDEWGPAVKGRSVEGARDLLVSYRDELLAENQVQNLTRIIEAEDFYQNNVLDCLALERSGFLSGQCAYDLGSGGGIPGLLHGCLNAEQKWVLGDSELKKAAFLARCANTLGLSNVSAVGGRAEDVLITKPEVSAVVSRAVGPVERLFNWIQNCSTWNTLILFKGPSWSEEWSAFQSTGKRNRLKISGEYPYVVGVAEKKQRLLIKLIRN